MGTPPPLNLRVDKKKKDILSGRHMKSSRCWKKSSRSFSYLVERRDLRNEATSDLLEPGETSVDSLSGTSSQAGRRPHTVSQALLFFLILAQWD